MNSTVVESTTLATVAYDEAREMLRLEFRSRQTLQQFLAAHHEVDLLLDIPLVAIDEPARLGYVDSTVPAVQDPAPLRSTRKI